MQPNDYQQLALRTEAPLPNVFTTTPEVRQIGRALHAAIGMCTETGELQDALKKYLFYGKTLDLTNVVEEFQDLLWYIAIGLDACGMTLEQAMERNIAKLKARYGEKFSSERALDRNLDAERAALEGKSIKQRHYTIVLLGRSYNDALPECSKATIRSVVGEMCRTNNREDILMAPYEAFDEATGRRLDVDAPLLGQLRGDILQITRAIGYGG